MAGFIRLTLSPGLGALAAFGRKRPKRTGEEVAKDSVYLCAFYAGED